MEDPPGVGNGNLLQCLCLKITWTEKPGRVCPFKCLKEPDTPTRTHTILRKKAQTNFSASTVLKHDQIFYPHVAHIIMEKMWMPEKICI